MRILLVFYFLLIEYICHFPLEKFHSVMSLKKLHTKSGVHTVLCCI